MSLNIYWYIKIESRVTTVVSINLSCIFYISLRLLFATVGKLFPTKLKCNRFFISFITHKDALVDNDSRIFTIFIHFLERKSFLGLFLLYEVRYVIFLYSLFIVNCSFIGLSRTLWSAFPLIWCGFWFCCNWVILCFGR